jgi:DNA-formamidopyrimidine glycosylase
MPEGPEVFTTARFHDKRFRGWAIEDLIHHTDKCLEGGHPERYLEMGTVITAITSRGKKLIMSLDNGDYICFAFKMEGKLHLKPANNHLHFTLHLYLEDEDTVELAQLYYCEARPFGGLTYCHGDDELNVYLANVGPDLIQDNITQEEWLARYRAINSKQPIGYWINQQQIFSGVGNYLRADILYHARIYPMAIIDNLSDQSLTRLYHSTIKIIKLAVKKKGMSSFTYLRPDGTRGSYKSLVYNRSHDKNGYPVIKTKIGTQNVHWVPEVQTRGLTS